MRDMEDRMGREASGYQDTIARLEADIAKMKVLIFSLQAPLETLYLGFHSYPHSRFCHTIVCLC